MNKAIQYDITRPLRFWPPQRVRGWLVCFAIMQAEQGATYQALPKINHAAYLLVNA